MDSLLEQEKTPELFSTEELALDKVGDQIAQGHYTGERLHQERPEIYREIVELLAMGASRRSIKARCKVHHLTIDAIFYREAGTIDTLRQQLARRMMLGSYLATESLIEDIEKDRLKPEAKAFAAKALAETANLMSGAATARIENFSKIQVMDELQAKLDALPLVDAQEISLISGNSFPLSGSGPDRLQDLQACDLVQDPAESLSADEESTVLEGSISIEGINDTALLPAESQETSDPIPGKIPYPSSSSASGLDKTGGEGGIPQSDAGDPMQLISPEQNF